MENSAYGEINERSFSNPHPWWIMITDNNTCQSCISLFLFNINGELQKWKKNDNNIYFKI